MPSALGTGITLLAIGGAAAATGGLVAPALGLGAGAGALGGFGLGTTLGGAFLGGTDTTPSAAGRAARRKQNIADAEMPREWIYGQIGVGFLRAWQGIPPQYSDQEWEFVDGVLASHPIEAVLGVQIGDDYLPITTNDGDAEGLILKSLTSAPGDDFFASLPNNTYVPVQNSAYRRVDNTKKSSSQSVIHLAFRFVLDGSSGVDSFFAANAGLNYNNVQRRYTGLSRFHASIRGNNEVGTLRVGPKLQFLVQGKNDIWDPRGGTGYSANAALVAADMVKTFFPISQADINQAALIEAADICDNTGWDPVPGGNQGKYRFHDKLRADEDAHANLMRVVAHMAGSLHERGREVIIRAGGARTKVLSLGGADMLGIGVLSPPQESELWNAVIPHYVPRFDENGRLHGKLRPAAEVTDAAYVAADGGQRRAVDRYYDGSNLGRRAEFLASIENERPRVMAPVGSRYTNRFKRHVMRVEKFDVIGVTDPAGRWVGEQLLQVVDMDVDQVDFSTSLTAIPYADSIYTPSVTVTEPLVGSGPTQRSRVIPDVQGLAFESVGTTLRADGRQLVQVRATWDAIGSVAVTSGGWVTVKAVDQVTGDVTIQTVAGAETEAILHLPNLMPQDGYARASGYEGGGSYGTTAVAFTPTSGVTDMVSAAVDASFGEELMANWNFWRKAEQAGVTQGALGWDFFDSSSAHGGYATRVILPDKKRVAEVRALAPPSGMNTYTIGPGDPLEGTPEETDAQEARIDVTPGTFYRAIVEAKMTSFDPISLGALRVQSAFYTEDGASSVESEPIRVATPVTLPNFPNRFIFFGDYFQVPAYGPLGEEITQMKIQAQVQAFAGGGGAPTTVQINKISCRRASDIRGNNVETLVDVVGASGFVQIIGSGKNLEGNTRPYGPPAEDSQYDVNVEFDWRMNAEASAAPAAHQVVFRLQAEPEGATSTGILILYEYQLDEIVGTKALAALADEKTKWATKHLAFPIFRGPHSGGATVSPNLPQVVGPLNQSQWKFSARLALQTPAGANYPGANLKAQARDRRMWVHDSGVAGDDQT